MSAGCIQLVVDLHGQEAQGATVDPGRCCAHGLQRMVGLAAVGGAHVVDQTTLERSRHGIPQMRLPQVQHLDGLAAQHTANDHQSCPLLLAVQQAGKVEQH